MAQLEGAGVAGQGEAPRGCRGRHGRAGAQARSRSGRGAWVRSVTQTIGVLSALENQLRQPEQPADNWPYPVDKPKFPLTCSFGRRHPLTQARTRMYKRGGQ